MFRIKAIFLIVTLYVTLLVVYIYKIYVENRIAATKGYQDSKYNDKIFVYSAYLINWTSIRAVVVRKCQTGDELLLTLKWSDMTSYTTPMIHWPIHYCTWIFSPKCDFVGYFAETTGFSFKQFVDVKGLPDTYISRANKPEVLLPIQLYDARVPLDDKRKHQLAICAQPLFYHADWTLTVQFFEMWIVQGVTKFYIYYQSFAPEIDALLKLYESDSTIDIERIPWSAFPTDGDYVSYEDDDPNQRTWRLEVVAAINDCILRSRGHAKYVISVDLDEIIVPHEQPSLLSLLNELSAKSEHVASFQFRNRFVSYENQWDSITKPEDFDFNGLRSVMAQNFTFPRDSRSKMVYYPEHVRTADVHYAVDYERDYFKGIIVPNDTALLYHIRRVRTDDYWSLENVFRPHFLERFIEPCNKAWQRRLKTVSQVPGTDILRNCQWPNRGQQVLQEMEACRLVLKEQHDEHCISPFRCYRKIRSLPIDELIFAEQSWVVL